MFGHAGMKGQKSEGQRKKERKKEGNMEGKKDRPRPF